MWWWNTLGLDPTPPPSTMNLSIKSLQALQAVAQDPTGTSQLVVNKNKGYHTGKVRAWSDTLSCSRGFFFLGSWRRLVWSWRRDSEKGHCLLRMHMEGLQKDGNTPRALQVVWQVWHQVLQRRLSNKGKGGSAPLLDPPAWRLTAPRRINPFVNLG